MRLVIAGWKKTERRLVVIVGKEIQSNVASRHLVAGYRVSMTVPGDDAVIAHARNIVAPDFCALGKADPDAIQSAVHRVVVHFVARTKSEFDSVVKN